MNLFLYEIKIDLYLIFQIILIKELSGINSSISLTINGTGTQIILNNGEDTQIRKEHIDTYM